MLAASNAAEFAVYDIYIDSQAAPLAAYQLKIWDKNAAIKIISVEGGEHPAFQKTPFFDPKAIQRDIIKLAALHTGPQGELPTSKVRVASLHVEIGPGLTPSLQIEVEAAARLGGKRISAEATLTRRNWTRANSRPAPLAGFMPADDVIIAFQRSSQRFRTRTAVHRRRSPLRRELLPELPRQRWIRSSWRLSLNEIALLLFKI